MKTKMSVAAVVVLMMVSASFAVLSVQDDASDAATTQSIRIGMNDSVGETMMLTFVKSQYEVAGVDSVSVAWAATISGTDLTAVRATPIGATEAAVSATASGSSKDLLKVTLNTIGEDGNNYSLTVRNHDDNTGEGAIESMTLSIIATPTLTIGSGSGGEGGSVILDPLTYKIEVTVVDDTMILGLSGTITQGTTIEGVTLTIDGESDKIGEYTWYAQGMPSGVALSSNGKIVGYPLADPNDYNVKVVAVHNTSGQTYHATLILTIAEASTEDPTVSISVTDTEDDGIELINGAYHVEEGTDISFTVTANNSAIQLVVAVNDSGEYTVLTAGDDDTYKISTSNGSGSFKIFAYAANAAGTSVSDMEQVYVHSTAAGELSAGIISSSRSP